MVDSGQALDIISKVIERADALGQAIPSFVVLVGGTALAAHSVRDQSEDVDFYAPESMDDAAFQIETELKPTFGDAFKIDVTVGENLWGDIILRDIAQSPEWTSIDLGDTRISVRVLTLQDLLLVKLAADRKKDRADLPLIAAKVHPEVVGARFNQVIKWHGNRDAVMGYADSFVIMMNHLYGLAEKDVIEKMAVSDYVRRALVDTYCDYGNGHGHKT